jgi:hypothetical protein
MSREDERRPGYEVIGAQALVAGGTLTAVAAVAHLLAFSGCSMRSAAFTYGARGEA